MHKRYNPDSVVRSFGNGYSQALEVDPNKRWLYTAGQVGADPNGNVSDIFENQVTQTWANIIALLNEGNMGVDDLVKINGFVVGAENFPAYAAARKEVLGEAKPASTAIIVPALAMPNWLVEIEVIAAR